MQKIRGKLNFYKLTFKLFWWKNFFYKNLVTTHSRPLHEKSFYGDFCEHGKHKTLTEETEQDSVINTSPKEDQTQYSLSLKTKNKIKKKKYLKIKKRQFLLQQI